MNYSTRRQHVLDNFPEGAYIEEVENISYLSELKIIHASPTRKCRLLIYPDRKQGFVLNRIYSSLVPEGEYYFDGHALPPAPAQLSAADNFVREMRFCKDGDEIAAATTAADLADWGMAQFRELLRPGNNFLEVRFEVGRRMASEANRRDGNGFWGLTISGSAGPSASPHSPSTESVRKLAAGDVVVAVIIAAKEGYHIECERTFILGNPSFPVRRCFEAMVNAQDAAIRACVPGMPISEIDRASVAVFKEAGLEEYVLHRAGHGMGIASQEYPLDTPFNDSPLKENCIMAIEPAIYLAGTGGFRHSQTVVCGKGVLGKYPRDLAALTLQ